jgi:hypothetical protein
MKKIIPVFFLILLLASCSSLPDITKLLATPTPLPLDTATPQSTVTLIPTLDLFATSTSTPITFTPTETPLVPDQLPTNTPTPRSTFSPPLNIGGGFLTPGNVGFLTILLSSGTIYWDEGPCMPRNIKISAFVEDTVSTDKVLLFMRLREKKNTLNLTKWGAGAEMIKADNGSYNYDVRTFNINRYYYYIDAWLEYQLVAVTKDLEVVGRTQIYDRNITLARCGGAYKK